jgi:oligosaccharide repeat unit polymerase
MTLAQIISLLIIGMIFFINLRKGSDFFSPGKLFALVWAFVIFITEFKFSSLQREWSLYSWIVLLTGLFSFIVGTFIVYVINITRPFNSLQNLREVIQTKDKYNFHNLYFVILIIFTLYSFSYLVEVIQFGGLPILSAFPDRARMDLGIFGLHLFVNAQPVLLFLCVEYFVLKSNDRKKNLIVGLIFFFTFASYFLLLERYNYFLLFVMVFGFLYYGSKIITFKKLFITIIVFIYLVELLQSIRISRYASQFIYIISKMKYSMDYAAFTGPYMYITMNLENFTRGVDIIREHSCGLLSADWIAALTGIKHQAAEYFGIDSRKYITTTYNTFPFMWDYFYDFGLVGVAVLPMILGFWISTIYYKMKTSNELKWLVIYAFAIFVIMFSFFTNVMSSLNTISNLFILWIAHNFFIIKKEMNAHYTT